MLKKISASAAVAASLAIGGGAAFAATNHAQPAPAKNYGGHHRHVYYGVGNGGETPRVTATGGNPGGYSNRN